MFGEQGIVGDQLGVERGINKLVQVGISGSVFLSRQDAMYIRLGDFSNMIFYHSAADKCTISLRCRRFEFQRHTRYKRLRFGAPILVQSRGYS